MLRKEIVTILVAVMLFVVCPVKADTVWTSGHYEIFNGDVYGEVEIYNDVTLDIFGGDIYRLAAYDTTFTNWYDGEMYMLWTYDDSIINIYGGELHTLWSMGNSLVNICAYDVTITDTGGYWDLGQVIGTYFSNDTDFVFNLWSQDTSSHINIVPEPTTLLLLSLGGLFLRRSKRKTLILL